MTKLIAIHEIVAHNPAAGVEHTGRFDDVGEPILLKVQHTISPGDAFTETDEAEVEWLLKVGAARLAEAEDLIL